MTIETTKSHFISIIIPVLNGEKFIDKCLKSMNELNYPKDNFEVIIVDNGSTDRTIDVIRNYQSNNSNSLDIKLYIEKIKSSYAARNLGIKNAKGSIIAFTDIDCIADKDWLINMVQHFSDNTVGGVAGEILPDLGDSLVERYTKIIGMLSQKATFSSKFLPYAATANVAYRKELFSRIGYFDEIMSGGDADYSWRVQLETNYNIIYVKDAIVFHKHRTDLKGLLKQTFRYGYGHEFIYEKYKNACRQHEKEHKKIRLGANYITKSINYLKTIRNDLTLLLPALIHVCGYNAGKMYGKLMLIMYKNKI